MSDKSTNTDGIATFGHEEQPRIIFPTLFTPKPYKKDGVEKGDPKYSASFLFPLEFEELQALRKKAARVLKAAYPDADLKRSKMPFVKGARMIQKEIKAAEKAGRPPRDTAFYEGMEVLKTSSKFAPTVLDARKSPPVETEDAKLVFSGAYVAAEVNFVAYESDETYEVDDEEITKKGVTAYLNTVVFVEKGKRIAGRDAAAAFKDIKGRKSQEDPTGGDGIDLDADGDGDYDFD
jgi:hypothetical protein